MPRERATYKIREESVMKVSLATIDDNACASLRRLHFTTGTDFILSCVVNKTTCSALYQPSIAPALWWPEPYASTTVAVRWPWQPCWPFCAPFCSPCRRRRACACRNIRRRTTAMLATVGATQHERPEMRRVFLVVLIGYTVSVTGQNWIAIFFSKFFHLIIIEHTKWRKKHHQW